MTTGVIKEGDLAAARDVAAAATPPGPLERALAEVEAGPVRRRAVSPLALLKNLRLARRIDLRALTADDVELDARARRVPRCDRCEDNCCRGPGTGISLRLADVARLVDAGLVWGVAREQRWTEADYEADPALREHEARETQRRFPMLKRRADGACVFLDDGARCSIHPIRPLACRAFPYRLNTSRERVHFSGRCPSWGDGGDAGEVAAMTTAVLELYNAKVRDLVVLAHGRREIDDLGLSRHLPIVE